MQDAIPPSPDPQDLSTELVMAMPRRLLWKPQGFIKDVDLAVLECVANESWFTDPALVYNNLEAKLVRIGVIIRQGPPTKRQVLVSESGVLLHAAAVPPELTTLGGGLRGLRELAGLAGKQLVGDTAASNVFIGYLNEDSLPETRPFFVLVYCLTMQHAVAAPPGLSWLAADRLHGVPLDPASLLVCEAAGG